MEFAKLNEGRLARRLRDRWKCKVGEHSYCFKTAESIHLQLTEGNIDEWANTIVRLHSFLFVGPRANVTLANSMTVWELFLSLQRVFCN